MDRRTPLAIGLDTFSVVLFVALGRRTHDQGSAIAGVLATAAPFLIGLAAGWLVWRAWRRPASVRSGFEIWPVTVLVGMLVRRFVFDDGTAASFVIVATLFVGALLVGWRAVVYAVERRRTPRDGQPAPAAATNRAISG